MFEAAISTTGTPTGTVDFLDGTTVLGTVAAFTIVSLSVTGLTTGSHSITVRYNGDSSHSASTSSPLTHTVIGAGSTAGAATRRTDSATPHLHIVSIQRRCTSATGRAWHRVPCTRPRSKTTARCGRGVTPTCSVLCTTVRCRYRSAVTMTGPSSQPVICRRSRLKTTAQCGLSDTPASGASVTARSTVHDTMAQIGIGEVWTSVVSGDSAALFALRADGTLWGWGVNRDSLLGDGSVVEYLSPTQIGTATDWAIIETEGSSAFGIRTDGTLWAWGTNYGGQLGLGEATGGSTRRRRSGQTPG